MKLAIVSDIHANLQAWNAVWADITAQDVGHVICLGDTVGYGPRPAETLAAVYSAVNDFVMGNHDAAVAGMYDIESFTDDAQLLIKWTATRLDAKAAEFFSQLPYVLNIDLGDFTAMCVHGSPVEPEEFNYIMDELDALAAWAATDLPLIFVGHTHQPRADILAPDGARRVTTSDFMLEPGCRYIVNVGSVGVARGQDFRACYLIFDTETMSLSWRRVPYDMAALKKDIQEIMGGSIPIERVMTMFDRAGTRQVREAMDFAPKPARRKTPTSSAPKVIRLQQTPGAGGGAILAPVVTEDTTGPKRSKLPLVLGAIGIGVAVLALAGLLVARSKKPGPAGTQIQTSSVPASVKKTGRKLPARQTGPKTAVSTGRVEKVQEQKTVKPTVFSAIDEIHVIPGVKSWTQQQAEQRAAREAARAASQPGPADRNPPANQQQSQAAATGVPAAGDTVTFTVREWFAIGSLGHESLSGMGEQPPDDPARTTWRRNVINTIAAAWAAEYYPMDRVVDLKETCKGAPTRDVFGKEHSLAWEKAWTATENDVFASHPAENTGGLGISYFSSWIYMSEDADVVMKFGWESLGYRRSQTAVNAWVNGEALKTAYSHPDFKAAVQPVSGQQVRLHKGWNHLYERVFTVARKGNPGACMMIVIPAGKVTGIKLKADPPREAGTRFLISGKPAN